MQKRRGVTSIRAMTYDSSNRRRHDRVSQKGYIKVVVEAAPDAPSLEGRVFRCTTRDLSSSGLQMVVHSNVPVGTMVRVHVVFTDPPAEFEHLARVAWARLELDDLVQDYAIGMELVSTDGQDDHEWPDLLMSRMLGSKTSPSNG